MWFLGMDVGTGGTRAVVVDAAGKLMGAASCAHAPFRAEHPGWAEQDPELYWQMLVQACQRLWIDSGIASARVAAVSLTTLRATVI